MKKRFIKGCEAHKFEKNDKEIKSIWSFKSCTMENCPLYKMCKVFEYLKEVKK